MEFLFYLPVWQGLIIIIIICWALSAVVVGLVRKLIEEKLTKQHERVGRLLFRVSAGLIALLISLSYANERVEYNRVRDSLEIESALIANVYAKLGVFDSKEAESIRQELIMYVDYTIEDEWKEANNNPYFSKITHTIMEINRLSLRLPTDNEEQLIAKQFIMDDLNEVAKLMQVRFFAKHALFPFLVYILGAGILFMWAFFSVYKIDVLSMIFLSLYNTFLMVLMYFIIVLSNPMVGTLKIDADAFIILKTKGFDKIKSE